MKNSGGISSAVRFPLLKSDSLSSNNLSYTSQELTTMACELMAKDLIFLILMPQN